MSETLDLGHGHTLTFLEWAPDDLEANRKLYGVPLPHVERAGAIVRHANLKTGGECASAIHFAGTAMATFYPEHHYWKVEQVEPLTLSPSLLCLACGDHGFIRAGKWVPA